MPTEAELFAERARQQADTFLQRSREQMLQSVQYSQAAMVGVAPGIGGRGAAAAGGDYPMSGSPAGRLLDTITTLVRRGAGYGVGAAGLAVGAAAQPFMAAPAGAGQVAGAGAAFMGTAGPFGPAGIAGGALGNLQQRMGFFQTLWTGYGAGLGTLGQYAAQRTDMDRFQAQQMAREELSYRFYGGLERGAFGALNLASFGLSNFIMRRQGMLMWTTRSEQYSREVQRQLRFLTPRALEEMGMGQFAGPFATGITREGARGLARGMAQEMGAFEQELGLAPREIEALQARAFGMMGPLGIERAMRRVRGAGTTEQIGQAFGAQVRRQSEAVLRIQRNLNIAEDEADEFFATLGQMYGTADRVAKMSDDARRLAGDWGMSKRRIFQMMTEFEDMGRTMGIGQERARGVGMDYAGAMREQMRLGIMGREFAMRYGGRTLEEALAIQTRTRFQMGVGMFERGALGGLGIMAAYQPNLFGRFMGGEVGLMEMGGAVGGFLARDPWVQMRARYDPAVRAQAGRLGLRMQFQRVQAAAGFFPGGGREEEMIAYFQRLTGLEDMEAAQHFRAFMGEHRVFADMAKTRNFRGDPEAHARGIQQVYQRFLAEGLLDFATTATGGTPYEAAAIIYGQMTDMGRLKYDTNTSVEDLLRQRLLQAAPRPAAIAQEIARAGFFQPMAIAGAPVPIYRAGRPGSAEGPLMTVGGTESRQGFLRDQHWRYFARTQEVASWSAAKEQLTRTEAARKALTTGQIQRHLQPLIAMGARPEFLQQFLLGGPGATAFINPETGRGGFLNVTSAGGLVWKTPQGKTINISSMEQLKTEAGGQAFEEIMNRMAVRAEELSDRGALERFITQGINTGELVGKEQNVMNALLFSRYAGTIRSIFPGIERGTTTPTDLGDFMRQLADLDVAMSGQRAGAAASWQTLTRLGLTQYQQFAQAFETTGRGVRLQGGPERVTQLFGGTQQAAEAIYAAFRGVGQGGGWGVEAISEALQGKGRAKDLQEMLTRAPVALGLLNQVMAKQNAESEGRPRGSIPGNPVYVEVVPPVGAPAKPPEAK